MSKSKTFEILTLSIILLYGSLLNVFSQAIEIGNDHNKYFKISGNITSNDGMCLHVVAIGQEEDKNGYKQDEVERFINWFGSGETQGEFAAEFASLPANQKALEMTDPEVLEAYEAIPPQELDWLFVRDNISQWVEKIELEYMP